MKFFHRISSSFLIKTIIVKGNRVKRFLCIVSLLFFMTTMPAKVLIITHSYNRPDFIKIQSDMFKRLLKDEYEFVVFSDAADQSMDDAIKNMCIDCQVTYVRVPQEIHSRPYLYREPGDDLNRPNIRHANVVQYSMDMLGFDHEGPVVILDSDMFLIRPMSVIQELANSKCDIISFLKGTEPDITYLCPAFMIFDMSTLPDKKTLQFNCGRVKGISLDSGGDSYYYLQNHPDLKIAPIHEIYSYTLFGPDRFVPDHFIDRSTPADEQIVQLQNRGFSDKEISFLQKKPHTISFLSNHYFLHYRAGSNYDNQSKLYDQQKMALIKNYLEDISQ